MPLRSHVTTRPLYSSRRRCAHLAMGGFAFAAIPSTNGTINGCWERAGDGRNLRVIDTAKESCKVDETAISWNQQGPIGPQGPQGPQGPTGRKGRRELPARKVPPDRRELPAR